MTKPTSCLQKVNEPTYYSRCHNGIYFSFPLSFYQYKDSEGTKGNITCWGLAERAFFREMWIPDSTHVKHVKLSNSRNQRAKWWMPGAGGRRNGEWLINRQKVCYTKWVRSRDLLYVVSHIMNTTVVYLRICLRVDFMLCCIPTIK